MRINDSRGHGAGDRVLRTVGQCLNQRLAGPMYQVSTGGEEFVILLPETMQAGAMQLAADLLADIERLPIPMDTGAALTVTASIGVACAQETSLALAALVKWADEAMFQVTDDNYLGRRRRRRRRRRWPR